MRALILAFATLLAVPPAAIAQRDWARAYEDGKKAFERNNCTVAESKMLEARETGPKQNRKHNWSSVVYRPFIPDYYLGLCAAQQGQYQKAERYLDNAIKQELVTQDDRKEYALATSTLLKAREEVQKLAAATKVQPTKVEPTVTPVPPTNTGTVATNTNPTATQSGTEKPPVTNTGTNAAVTPATVRPPVTVTPPVTAPPAWAAEFNRSMEAARQSRRQGRYSEARGSVSSAASAAGDNPSRQMAEQLRREIERDVDAEALRIADRARAAIGRKDADGAQAQALALEGLDGNHPALTELRTQITQLRDAIFKSGNLAQIEKAAVKLFLAGNYKPAEEQLQRAVGAGVTSPRIYLFLASSRAARALLAKPAEKPALIAEAKKAYALAQPQIGALAADRRFISPSILNLLTSGS
jgi:hypothetical protein